MNTHLDKIKSHAMAVHTRLRQEVEDARQAMAMPGDTVYMLRKPWKLGQPAFVKALTMCGTDIYLTVSVGGRWVQVPASAVSKSPGGVNCHLAQIRHTAAFVKFSSGEFLE